MSEYKDGQELVCANSGLKRYEKYQNPFGFRTLGQDDLKRVIKRVVKLLCVCSAYSQRVPAVQSDVKPQRRRKGCRERCGEE